MNLCKFFSSVRNLYWKKKKPSLGKYVIVKPGKVSPRKFVPDHIPKPSYYLTGEPTENIEHPDIKNEQQIQRMRASCRLAANILKKIGENIKVGQTTDEIDISVYETCIQCGAYPSPLNYKHFPKSVCTSVNNVACHGIPDDRPLEDGDIINVDITTFLVGNVDSEGKELVRATEICLNEAIEICKPGQYFRAIGAFIEGRAHQLGFRVVPAFIGHGIGHYFHGPPDIYHFKNSYPGVMEAGMTFTIEPILTQGEELIEILHDNWTAVTYDCARTAQFEHTVLITDSGADILTLPN
ncbi:methionine aminopeptidase 1D, mitochondrial isoform X2 [Anoplophora glabripennis]|uniref:methionine aminopeptidase 1D, mitochondrial isoform X2 n=1 Tax=Anoplophora glabripennis TaxID=217634 RepID=UPI00087539E1|nr:methionine aminopeptidase 1D, mitochondrial isoform X2 [Anoplophora glabripennis]